MIILKTLFLLQIIVLLLKRIHSDIICYVLLKKKINKCLQNTIILIKCIYIIGY